MNFDSYTHYVFDFDGTLFDTAPDVVHSLQKTLQHYGYATDAVNVSLLGPVLEKILEHLCPASTEEERAYMVQYFRNDYRQCGFELTIPFPGVPALLNRLRHAEKSLYIATNKPRQLTHAILEYKGFTHFFTDVVCCDSGETKLKKYEMLSLLQRRFAFLPSEGIMIGDTAEDIRSGKKAEMATCAAYYGYGTQESLLAEQPDFAVPSAAWLTISPVRD